MPSTIKSHHQSLSKIDEAHFKHINQIESISPGKVEHKQIETTT